VPALDIDYYLRGLTGLVHVGANTGQEREVYRRYELNVLWIEPLPDVFEQLQENIAHIPRQKAIRALITDRDGQEYSFNIANNGGASSSIFELARHREIWPDVHFVRSMTIKSTTLDTILEGATRPRYDALVIDTQGSELLVLKGARGSLTRFRYIKTEAANFESYKSGAQARELVSFLAGAGFRLVKSVSFARSPEGGRYFELLFEKGKSSTGLCERRTRSKSPRLIEQGQNE